MLELSHEHHSKVFYVSINHYTGAAHVKSVSKEVRKPDGLHTKTDAERMKVKEDHSKQLLNQPTPSNLVECCLEEVAAGIQLSA